MLSKNDGKWIYELDELSQQAILNTIENDLDNLSKPREINYCIYGIPSQSSAARIKVQLENNGWVVHIYEEDDDSNSITLEAQKQGYTFSKNTYLNDVQMFNLLADEHGAEYDGWYASVG